MRRLPKVVIVGRTNVGKSTLFNRLSENAKSIVLDYEGVTRDFVSDVVCWKGSCFTLIDSGGIETKPNNIPIAEQVRRAGLKLLEDADIILFVCDGTVGVTLEDKALAKYLHKIKKPIILVINKIDSSKAQIEQYEFQKLGFKTQFAISAQHGSGIASFLDGILAQLPEKHFTSKTTSQNIEGKFETSPRYHVVLIGKPNVGKSSLMNLLLEQERVIVSQEPGTTREAITEPIRFYQETITVTDTPGIRKKSGVREPLEQLMVKSSLNALSHAQIVLLLIDGTHGKLSDQELKLAFYAFREGKALLLLINKTDLMDEQQRETLEENFDEYQFFLSKIPHLFISCRTNKNIGKIMPLVSTVWKTYNYVFEEGSVGMILKSALKKTPLYHKTELLRLKSARQIGVAPITILVHVNEPKWFGPTQLSFLENSLRKNNKLLGVPIVFVIRKG